MAKKLTLTIVETETNSTGYGNKEDATIVLAVTVPEALLLQLIGEISTTLRTAPKEPSA